MKKRFLLLILGISSLIFSQDIPTNPKDIVNYALNALTNGEIEKLLSITGNAELRKTKELLTLIQDDDEKRKEILGQYKNLKSWTIENIKEHKINNRDITIVNTKWIISIPLEQNRHLAKLPKNIGKNQIVYMDYMLEKLNNKWKIISKKSFN